MSFPLLFKGRDSILDKVENLKKAEETFEINFHQEILKDEYKQDGIIEEFEHLLKKCFRSMKRPFESLHAPESHKNLKRNFENIAMFFNDEVRKGLFKKYLTFGKKTEWEQNIDSILSYI